MKEGLIKDVYEAIIKEIQTIITISYILAVGVGMLFNYHKYAEFGINIFDYADVFDFLIAPFADSQIFFFAIFSTLIPFLFFKLDVWMKNRFPKHYSKVNFGLDKKKWYNKYRIASFVLLFILYLYIFSDIYGKNSKEKIEQQSPISIRFSDNDVQKGLFIGKTKEILFILTDDKVKAIPISSLVKEIELNALNTD